MDPNISLHDIFISLTSLRLKDAKRHAEDLAAWVREGGAPPERWATDDVLAMCARIMAARDAPEARHVWNPFAEKYEYRYNPPPIYR